MNLKEAASALSSLSQESRLKAFKLLVKAGFDGLLAGEISKKMDVPQNTMSFHLAHLEKNELIKKSKSGRCVTYTANFKAMGNLIKFLFKNCCADSNQESCIDHNILKPCKTK
jgi:DNA-binding transcriptional ArsR family regulator